MPEIHAPHAEVTVRIVIVSNKIKEYIIMQTPLLKLKSMEK